MRKNTVIFLIIFLPIVIFGFLSLSIIQQSVYGQTGSGKVTIVGDIELFCGKSIEQWESEGVNIIIGTEKKDKLKGSNEIDLIIGLGGDDRISGKGGDDCLVGGEGKDRIMGGNGNDVIFGDEGKDRIHGGKGDDTINSGPGDDRVNGNKGDDQIIGGSGNDRLHGNRGNDVLIGEEGDDKLKGNQGDDILLGNEGNDHIFGNQGDDKINGGEDFDTCKGGSGFDIIVNCEDKDKDDDDDDKENCDCEKPSIFTVRYSGPDDVSIEIYKNAKDIGKSKYLLHTFNDVNNGVSITLNSEDHLDKSKLESNTVYSVIKDGTSIAVVSIHTSCSQVLHVDQTHSDGDVTLTVLSGTDLAGKDTIPGQICADDGKGKGHDNDKGKGHDKDD